MFENSDWNQMIMALSLVAFLIFIMSYHDKKNEKSNEEELQKMIAKRR